MAKLPSLDKLEAAVSAHDASGAAEALFEFRLESLRLGQHASYEALLERNRILGKGSTLFKADLDYIQHPPEEPMGDLYN